MQVKAELTYVKQTRIGVGQGMNSEVFLVDEPQLGGKVVVKEIPLANFGNNVSQYFSEARAMFATDHPNVVPVKYAAQTSSFICLAMPFYPAGSAADRIAAGPMRLSEAIRTMHDVLAGLACIHTAGYVHFDVKPSNVLFSGNGQAHVADFGQARSIGAGGHASVPPLYWAGVPPEAISGAATASADVYQAGLLFYRLVNGDPEWRSQAVAWAKLDPSKLKARIANGKVPSRSRFLPHVPAGIRRVIRRALQTDPVKRWQTAVDFADALGRVSVSLDWSCSCGAVGDKEWQVTRPNQADFVVRLQSDSGTWSVKVFTRTPSAGERAKDPATSWKKGLTLLEAETHLEGVFKGLS